MYKIIVFMSAVPPGRYYTHLVLLCTSWHLKVVLSIVQHLTLAIFVVYGEWVNLAIVSTCHLVL